MNPALTRHLQTLGLERAPFPPTPDAAAWFQTARLEAERVEAAHCLRTRAGFVLLTGEIGTGKSTFLRRLLYALGGEGMVTSLVFNTFLQGPDLLAAVLRDFGLEARDTPAADIDTLNRFLVQQWRAQVTCVLMIDDAQNLTLESLELLRLLTNLETGQEKLLQIVLAGQPELRANLEQPGIRQLTSRICKHVQLDVLAADEVQRYVHFRLDAAGNPSPGIRLRADAALALHRASGGNPRRIHQIMDRCLYGLYALAGAGAGDRSGTGAYRRRRSRRAPAGTPPAAYTAVACDRRLAGRGAGRDTCLSWRCAAPIRAPSDTPPVAAACRLQASAASARDDDADWNGCLRRLGQAGVQVQAVTDAWLARLPTREGLCLRGWPRAGRRDGVRGCARRISSPRRTSVRACCAVQVLLQAEGLYGGTLDGLYGPRMRAAIARFQQHSGLPLQRRARPGDPVPVRHPAGGPRRHFVHFPGNATPWQRLIPPPPAPRPRPPCSATARAWANACSNAA
ncbi:MAG: AAA family ATPase [Stenotrophomonas sp.]